MLVNRRYSNQLQALTRFLLAVVCALVVLPGQSLLAQGPYTSLRSIFGVPGSDVKLGKVIAGGFDFNNDGYDDYIIGVPEWKDSVGWTRGKTYAYSGKDGSLINSLEGSISALWGRSVDGIGDIDGDGYDDYLIGSKSRVQLWLSKSLFRLRNHRDPLLASSSSFGHAVANVGDMNMDGFDDYAGGDPGKSSGKGMVTIWSGKTGDTIRTHSGAVSNGQFGFAIAGAGDSNNDGYADIVIGAPRGFIGGASLIGKVFLYSGKNGSLLASMTNGSKFGQHVAGAGDVNNDGFDDFIASAATSGEEGGEPIAIVDIFSGKDGSSLNQIVKGSPFVTSTFGKSIAGVGDINGDGFADYGIGEERFGSNRGAVFIYSGKDHSVITRIDGTEATEHFGYSLAFIGDINKDGNPDIAVGAPYSTADGASDGRFDLFGVAPLGCCEEPGDADSNGSVNIADVSFVIAWLFAAGPSPTCCAEADANGDESLNIADITFVISWLFAGGADLTCPADDFSCMAP